MIRVAAAALLLFVSAGNSDDQTRMSDTGRGVIVYEQIVVRVTPVPRNDNRMGNVRQNIAWQEARGPSCIPIRQIVGAAQIGQESVDLILRDSTRIRARLERRCPAMDYYRGIYFRPSRDGMICAERDEFRARSGGSCEIEQFRLLRPRVP